MDINESIARLGAEFDACWSALSPLLDSEDRVAQGKVLLRGIKATKEYDRLMTEGRAAIRALIDRHEGIESARIASLVEAFAFAAKLANTLHDEFHDIDGETQVARFTQAIVKTFEDMETNRAPLAVLLDHPDAGVRAWAGACLINLHPDRVVPLLRDIKRSEFANCAHFTASFALLRWEHEGK
jgi:hypothetical protein